LEFEPWILGLGIWGLEFGAWNFKFLNHQTKLEKFIPAVTIHPDYRHRNRTGNLTI
jgi:hypothetical protein